VDEPAGFDEARVSAPKDSAAFAALVLSRRRKMRP
jgi:hypothetical protein